jgi:exonuclease SbcC
MIPLKLELTNFLSYRETAVLPFEHIHLACIAGANGAGKSSLLDGITWALFGHSRSKLDDDVVNRWAALSGGTAEVRFTFCLESTVYRVTRRKPHGKTATLELQILAGDDNWKILTESKIRETQAKIEQLLRMNYETFINASFLLQGKADEFTNKSPNKRKEILADLLGLGIWDTYKERATERRKQEEGQQALLDGQLADIEAELAEEEERKAALAAAKEAHTAVAERLANKQALLEQLRRTEQAIAQQKKNVENLKANLARTERALADLARTRQQRQAEREGYAAILAQTAAITTAYIAWQTADQQWQSWQAKADEYNRLQQARRPYELTITQEKSRLAERRRELETQQRTAVAATQEKAQVEITITQAQEKLTATQMALAELAAQEEQWHTARTELTQLESERQAQQRELQQLQNRATQMEKMRQEQAAVTQNLQEAETMLAEVTAEIAAMAEVNSRYYSILADKGNLESRQASLKELMNKHKERIENLTAETGSSCPLCGQPLTAEHRETVLADLQVEGKRMGDEFRENKTQLESITAEIATLDARIKQSPKLEQQQQTQQDRRAKAAARLEEMANALAEWEVAGAKQLVELQTAVANTAAVDLLKQQMEVLHTAVQEKSRLDKERQELERQIATGQARLGEIERITTTWQATGQAELAEVAKRLEMGDFEAAAQAALVELDAQVAAVAYDEAAHTAARNTRTELADAPQKQRALENAQSAVKPLEDNLTDLAAQMATQEQVVVDLQQQVETAVAELQSLTADGADLRRVESEAMALREEEIEANRKVGVAQNRLEILGNQRTRRQRLNEDRAALSQRIQRLKLLEKAFGREGVQSLLIEHAKPELEDRANELLDRLTGGEMSVQFRTVRENKTNENQRETLDIVIRDNAGERPYDNFSGGEQFRVNFAIRLALSQLLAHRAGARLQTLVIDEGFGSQDPQGRQRLVEAINTIQEDFKVILVITHIDELRDAFPTRIEVEKRPSGSTISIS